MKSMPSGITRDRLHRSLILGSSAPFPRPLRVRARYRLLGRLHMQTARRADVFVVRHPKTGGTWLRVLITRLYASKYGLSSRRAVRTDELHNEMPALPRFCSSSGYLSWERQFGDTVATDPELRRKKLILLARHPCDIAVSWYRQFTKRTSAFKRELLLHEMEMPIDRADIGMWEYVIHPEIGLPAIIDYYNYWGQNVSQLENALVVRYEDLRSDTAAALARLGEFLGEEFSEEHIRDAVDFGTFENMRELEQSNYFANRSLKLRNPDDPDTLKVRRGVVGGYREDLDEAQACELEAMVDARLDPVYGYTGRASAR
jgi:hypothetical protein